LNPDADRLLAFLQAPLLDLFDICGFASRECEDMSCRVVYWGVSAVLRGMLSD